MRNCQPRPLEDKPKGRAPAEAWVCAAIRQRLHLRPQQQLPAVGISYVLGVVPETASTERGPLRLPGRPQGQRRTKKGKPASPFSAVFSSGHTRVVFPRRTCAFRGGGQKGCVHVAAGSWVPLSPRRTVDLGEKADLCTPESGHQDRAALLQGAGWSRHSLLPPSLQCCILDPSVCPLVALAGPLQVAKACCLCTSGLWFALK